MKTEKDDTVSCRSSSKMLKISLWHWLLYLTSVS